MNTDPLATALMRAADMDTKKAGVLDFGATRQVLRALRGDAS